MGSQINFLGFQVFGKNRVFEITGQICYLEVLELVIMLFCRFLCSMEIIPLCPFILLLHIVFIPLYHLLCCFTYLNSPFSLLIFIYVCFCIYKKVFGCKRFYLFSVRRPYGCYGRTKFYFTIFNEIVF